MLGDETQSSDIDKVLRIMRDQWNAMANRAGGNPCIVGVDGLAGALSLGYKSQVSITTFESLIA